MTCYRDSFTLLTFFYFTLIIIIIPQKCECVGIATGYGLEGRGSIPSMGKEFSPLHSEQTDSGAHPASHLMGTGGSFPRDVNLTTSI
jgi:hypothetical protein